MLLKLKILLMQRKLPQKELSRGIGMSESRLSRIIQGRVRPRARERRLIAEKLGVPQVQIFGMRRFSKRQPKNTGEGAQRGDVHESHAPETERK